MNKEDGAPYPPNTLYQIVAGWQRHIKMESGVPSASLKECEICASVPGAGWQNETVDCNWHWDGEKQAQPLTPAQEDMLREKIFTI